MIRHYFLFGPKPPSRGTYNALQMLAYTTALALGAILAVSGLALYKPVQLSWLVDALGGFRMTRVWHFAAMCGLLAFIPGHVIMVALHGRRNFVAMWTGFRRIVVVIFLATVCSPGVAFAQSSGIAGMVRDETGRALPGVAVSLRVEGAEPRWTETDADGRYRFETLPAGARRCRSIS
jgi:hypothetical protein